MIVRITLLGGGGTPAGVICAGNDLTRGIAFLYGAFLYGNGERGFEGTTRLVLILILNHF